MYIDHADIVVTHKCNLNCPFCIDPLRNTDDSLVKFEDVQNFLSILRKHTQDKITVLLLGGDPTTAETEYLIQLADLIHSHNFKITMSTNGTKRNIILNILPHFDSIQITAHSQKEINFWAKYGDKINLKISGDADLTYEKLIKFIDDTDNMFYRRSVSMYFTPDFQELCQDQNIWNLLDDLDWSRNGSYNYAFYRGVRFKRCLPGLTNIIDEPSVPKLYPNGNYNKTWNNEENNPYLG